MTATTTVPSAEQALAELSILLVEDQYLLAEELKGILAGAGGRIVGPAGTVQAALAMIAAEHPDLAVLDVNLRRETVFPVAAALQAAGTPFLFVTGYEDWVIPSTFSRAPVLEKPVSAAALIRAARALRPLSTEAMP